MAKEVKEVKEEVVGIISRILRGGQNQVWEFGDQKEFMMGYAEL